MHRSENPWKLWKKLEPKQTIVKSEKKPVVDPGVRADQETGPTFSNLHNAVKSLPFMHVDVHWPGAFTPLNLPPPPVLRPPVARREGKLRPGGGKPAITIRSTLLVMGPRSCHGCLAHWISIGSLYWVHEYWISWLHVRLFWQGTGYTHLLETQNFCHWLFVNVHGYW